MTVGEKIIAYRKHKEYSQEYIAYKLDLSVKTINLWETNQSQPSKNDLIRLSELFEVPLNNLVDSSDEEFDLDPVIASATYRFSQALIQDITKMTHRKSYTISRLILLFSFFYLVFSFYVDSRINVYVVIILGGLCLVAVIRDVLTNKKMIDRVKKDLSVNPNKSITFNFYLHYLKITVINENKQNDIQLLYSNIIRLYETDFGYYINYANQLYPVPKNVLQGDFLKIKNNILGHSSSQSIDLVSSKSVKFSKILFLINAATLPVAVFAAALYKNTLFWFSSAGIVLSIWILLLFLPIPIVTLILSRKTNVAKSRNTISSLIVLFMLLSVGCINLAFHNRIYVNNDYLFQVEETLHYDFPSSMMVVSTNTHYSFYTNVSVILESDILFTKGAELSDFDDFVLNNYESKESIQSLYDAILPYPIVSESIYEYYALYNITNDHRNEIMLEAGTYQMMMIAYDIDQGVMKITVYNLTITA
ncbi:MAG: helix-turn-helix domain-containing protein [Candidatus Izemoplasmatales bacterium]